MDKIAFAASNPLLRLFDFIFPQRSKACFLLSAVIIPFPIGLLYEIHKF